MIGLPRIPRLRTTKQKRRAYMVGATLLSMAAGIALIASSMQDQISFFVTPTELSHYTSQTKIIRLGGMVVPGSVIKPDPLNLEFALTDTNAIVLVRYSGMVPSLFREGQGVVVKGKWLQEEQVFIAAELLAKHDERYMPPEVAKTMQGQENYYKDRSFKVR